jgi:PAS domain S-box-containing protein
MNAQKISEIIAVTKNLKLLYVEDNDDVRESTLLILNNFFTDIDLAHDGVEGLVKFEANKYDLIITDINMPRLNGLDMIEKIRKLDSSIPVLITSAYSETNYFVDAISKGIDGYILKPIDLNQFIGMFKKIADKIKLKVEHERNLNILNQYKYIVDKSSLVAKTDLGGNLTFVNEKFCNSIKYEQSELIGKNTRIFKHPDRDEEVVKDLWHTIKEDKKSWNGVLKNRTKDNKAIYFKSTITPILDLNGDTLEYISLSQDITKFVNSKTQLLDDIKYLEHPIFVLIKIEHYKNLKNLYTEDIMQAIENEFFDHDLDTIHKKFSFDKRYNLGNGEFGFLKNSCHDMDSFCQVLPSIKQNIEQRPNREFGHFTILISYSTEKNRLLDNTKLGIKKAYKEMENKIVFSNGLASQAYNNSLDSMSKIEMIKSAISAGRITTHLQPIYNNNTKRVEKYELLVRLIDKDGKVYSPFYFLDIAKSSKFYLQITQIVMDKLFEVLQMIEYKFISINLSILDIENANIKERFLALLEANKDVAHRIIIELLEDEKTKDFNVVNRFIKDVKHYGVRVAIDDFGSGYSNFKRLLDYSPDIIKIDGSLIQDLEYNKYSKDIVSIIQEFAKKQNIETIAEFVSNRNLLDIVTSMGIDFTQGYEISKPLDLQEILKNFEKKESL